MASIRSITLSLLLAFILLFLRQGYSGTDDSNRIIRLATTTSTDNSGLLTYLLPEFERNTGFRVHVIAVGTGKALRMGRDGDADVLLVHAPAAEMEFVKNGHGDNRHPVMYNDFVLVGPDANHRDITISDNINAALRQIADNRLTFISRGDNSGTHKKERTLWRAVDITPDGIWYREVGQGMGKVLQMAAELDAYTLTDRGTWLAYQHKSPLKVLNQRDPQLYNPYHIIAVNHQKYPSVNHEGAEALISWITSTNGQSLIGQYMVNGTVLFKPSAAVKELAERTSAP